MTYGSGPPIRMGAPTSSGEQARRQLAEPEAPNRQDVVADSDEFGDAPTEKPESGQKRP